MAAAGSRPTRRRRRPMPAVRLGRGRAQPRMQLPWLNGRAGDGDTAWRDPRVERRLIWARTGVLVPLRVEMEPAGGRDRVRRGARRSGRCSHTSRPFPAAPWSGRLWGGLCERTILGALDRGQRAAVGGRSRRRRARVPGLSWAAVAVGVRALARGAPARWRAVGHDATRVLWELRRYACALPVVVGSAPARRGGGDRRGAAPSRPRGGASSDRSAARPATGNGPGVAARRQGPGGEPARVRREVRVRARSRAACRGRSGRQRARRRGRGDDARRQGLGLRFGPKQSGPWERAVWLTGGLLYGRPGLPP